MVVTGHEKDSNVRGRSARDGIFPEMQRWSFAAAKNDPTDLRRAVRRLVDPPGTIRGPRISVLAIRAYPRLWSGAEERVQPSR